MSLITHIKAPLIAEARVFNNVRSLDDLNRAIVAYGNDAPGEDDDTYNNRTGWAYEVFAEGFLKLGLKDHPAFGITDVRDTSQNQFNGGFDYTYHDLNGNLGLIQVKFRSNPLDTFTRSELGTFVSWADELRVPPERRILFTNLKHIVTDGLGGVFHFSYAGGTKQMRVLGRIEQEAIIDRDPSFWE